MFRRCIHCKALRYLAPNVHFLLPAGGCICTNVKELAESRLGLKKGVEGGGIGRPRLTNFEETRWNS